jgi:hypothetical protein
LRDSRKKEDEYDQAIFQLMEARRQQYGRKSERFIDEENPQIPLFPVEFNTTNPDPSPDDIETVTYTRPKGGKRRPLDTSWLPKREVILKGLFSVMRVRYLIRLVQKILLL